jgi:hypothetical protein
VTSKTITSAQEQTLLKQLQTGSLPLWNAPVKHAKPTPAATPKTAV